MSKQIEARRMNRKTGLRSGARDALLAGIGAVSLVRKNAGKSLAEAASVIERLPEASSILIEGIGERTQALKTELLGRVASLDTRARVASNNGIAEVESRLRRLLRKLGIEPVRTTHAGKPAKRGKATVKPAAKRGVRKPRKVA